jgi:hypothetical protein
VADDHGARVDGLAALYTTAPVDVAADCIEMQDSPCAANWLKHLGANGLKIQPVMKRLKAEVIEMNKIEQWPWTNTDLVTEIYLEET